MPVTGARAGLPEPGVGYRGALPGKRRKLKRRVKLGRTSDRRAARTWERLRERPVMGIMADSVGITSGVDAGLTGGKSAEPQVKSLPKLPGFNKKVPKPAAPNPKAKDRDGDGLVQDGTTAERPAAVQQAAEAAKKVIDWKEPMLGKRMIGKPRSTKSALWDKKEQRFIRPRRKFHKRVVQDYLDRAGPSKPKGKGRIVFMGGGPASRKSSAIDAGLIKGSKNLLTVDPDGLKNYIPEYRAWMEDGVASAAADVHEEAKHMSELVNHALVAGGHDFLLDTTGDGSYDKLKKRLEGLRRDGHKIEAHYMTNSIDTAMKLNEERFKETGRKVFPGDLLHMHRQVSQNVPKALEDGLFDEFHLYDSDDLSKDPIEIARKMPGGELEILDQDKWDAFIEKGKPPPPPPMPERPAKPAKGPKQPSVSALFDDWMSSIYDDYEPQSDIVDGEQDMEFYDDLSPMAAQKKPGLPGFGKDRR